MQIFLTYGFYIALAALVIVLGLGLANLVRRDEKQASRSNQLMRLRIFVQAIVILILIAMGLAAGAFRSGG